MRQSYMERICLGFFPQIITDGFVVSKWAPKYAMEQFVVLVRHKSASLIRLKMCFWRDTNLRPTTLEYPALPTLGHCFIKNKCPPTYTDYKVLHSPHYIAEITFEDIEPTEFVFWYGKIVLTQTNLCQ